MDAQIDYSSSLIEEREQGIKEIESTMWVACSQNLPVFFVLTFKPRAGSKSTKSTGISAHSSSSRARNLVGELGGRLVGFL
jgi:hypothetical protein